MVDPTKRQDYLDKFEHLLNEWKETEMAIFTKHIDFDVTDTSKMREVSRKLAEIKKEDYASDEDYRRAENEFLNEVLRSDLLAKRDELEEKIRNMFKETE